MLIKEKERASCKYLEDEERIFEVEERCEHQGGCYSKGERNAIPSIFTPRIYWLIYVNNVNMLSMVPSMEIKAKAPLVNG